MFNIFSRNLFIKFSNLVLFGFHIILFSLNFFDSIYLYTILCPVYIFVYLIIFPLQSFFFSLLAESGSHPTWTNVMIFLPLLPPLSRLTYAFLPKLILNPILVTSPLRSFQCLLLNEIASLGFASDLPDSYLPLFLLPAHVPSTLHLLLLITLPSTGTA